MAVIKDGIIEKWWQEPGINNTGSDDDPYIETKPENPYTRKSLHTCTSNGTNHIS